MATTDDELLPSEVRVRILEDHDSLRALIAKVHATAEHESQRAILKQAREELATAGRTPIEVVARMQQFADRLEKDMELEEKTNLDEELLREFPIRVDFGGA